MVILKYLFLAALFCSVAFSETKVLFLGDSLTEGYGVKKENAYPQILENELKGKIISINGGVSGSTTASGLSRLRWQLRAKPKVVVLALGANDGLRGVPVKTSKDNLQKIIDMALEKKLIVVLTGMFLPQNYGDEYRKNFEKMFLVLAKANDVIFMPFLLKDVARVKELNIDDGIHPNEEGHKLMAKNLKPFIEKALKKVLQ